MHPKNSPKHGSPLPLLPSFRLLVLLLRNGVRIELEHVSIGEVEGFVVVCERRKSVVRETRRETPSSEDHGC